MHGLEHAFHQAVLALLAALEGFGYPGIFILMMLESMFFPVPSELVMIPAGYLVFQGKLNMGMVILMGGLGSLAGALANYGLAVWLGRAFLVRYGRFMLLPPKKLELVDRFFLKHGEITTFVGRLILGVRHVISFPAGLARMPLGRFCFYTTFGATIWCAILAYFGRWVGGTVEGDTVLEIASNAWKKHGHPITAGVLCGVALLIAGYVLVHRVRKPAPPRIVPGPHRANSVAEEKV